MKEQLVSVTGTLQERNRKQRDCFAFCFTDIDTVAGAAETGPACLSLWICEPCQGRCFHAAGSRALSCQHSLNAGSAPQPKLLCLTILRLSQLSGEPSATVGCKELAYISNRTVTLTACSSDKLPGSGPPLFTLNFLNQCI